MAFAGKGASDTAKKAIEKLGLGNGEVGKRHT